MPEFASVLQLSALTGTNGFRLDGADRDETGVSVASAGDINGDGFADLIVGSPFTDFGPYGVNAGASFVVFGKAAGFSSSLQLSSLNGSNGFRLVGAAAGDMSGGSVASAGDVNGDGFADLIVGAVSAGHGGASYVVFGKASGFSTNLHLSTLNGRNGFRLDADFGDLGGFSVASAGDVNGDGFADLIVGAPFAGSFDGASYVVFGKAAGFSSSLQLSSLDGSNGFRLDGASGDFGSKSVASAGDVNGDGFGDLIVGAVASSTRGASYVVFGKAAGFSSSLQLSSLDGSNGFRLEGMDPGRQGPSVASAGDINGDGFADLIVGVYGRSASYVVFGKASGFSSNLHVSSLDGTNGFRLNGVAPGDSSGWSVASAGDVNGDGFADLIIGAPDRLSESGPGSSYVVFGKAGGFSSTLQLSSLNGNNGFRLEGVSEDERTGSSVAAAGDVNGDGFGDLIVGAPRAGPQHVYNGASYVIYGHRALDAVNRVGTNLAQTINGGFGKDTITALGGNDNLIGWEGNDRLNGGLGNDTLSAGAGADVLAGGLGRDIMIGGGGNDRFYFNAVAESGATNAARDVVADFAAGTLTTTFDRIGVVAVDANTAIAGNQAFLFGGPFTAGHIRVVQSGNNVILQFNTDADAAAEMTLKLNNVSAANLNAGDFIL